MTAKVKQLLKTSRRLHKRAQRTKTTQDIEKHKDARREAKTAWRKAETEFYTNIDSKLKNSNNGSRKYWSIIKNVLGNKKTEAIPCIIDGDTIATTNAEKADILNTYFATQSTMPPLPPNHQLPPPNYLTDIRLHSVQTTPLEVYKILTRLNTNKASGPDLISNRILKEAAVSLSEPLSDIYNKSFNQGKFPSPWKLANVTPVYKKGDRQNKTNYRPIALLSNISKIQERIAYLTDSSIIAVPITC